MGASPLLGLGFGQWKGGIWEGIPPNHSPRVITSPREDSPETSKAIHSFTETWKLSPYQLCRYSAQTNPLKLRTTSDARPETRICKPIWKMAIRKITVIIARKLGNAPESSRISAVVRQAWSAIMMPIARKEQTRPNGDELQIQQKDTEKQEDHNFSKIWVWVCCNQNSSENVPWTPLSLFFTENGSYVVLCMVGLGGEGSAARHFLRRLKKFTKKV